MSPKKQVSSHREHRPSASPGASRTPEDRFDTYRRQRRRRVLAMVLFSVAGLVVVSHLLEHLDVLRLMSPTAQDVFVGYPTAGLLAILGGILWGVS